MRFPKAVPRDRDFDAIGFGTNAVDYLVTVPGYPNFGSKSRLVDYRQEAGGEVATAMAGLSRLGIRTAYAGRFGSDAEGVRGMQSLRDDGVDVSYAEIVEGCRTQIAFIIIDQASGERTVIWDRDPRLVYPASEAPSGIAARAGIIHMTPHDSAACIRLADEAGTAGTIVSLDLDNLFDGLETLLPKVDVAVTSEELPERLLGIREHERALAEMSARYGCSLTGMTLGDRGSLFYCGGSFIRSEGFEVPGGCRDTTGAGDAFRAGLLYSLLKGQELEEAARTANAVAALKCRAIGARTALPTTAELENFLSNR